MKKLSWTMLLLQLFSFSAAYSDEFEEAVKLERWRGYVRDFRSEHQFALSIGSQSGTWSIKPEGAIEKRKVKETSALLKFQYSYHIQLWRKIGYFLGSSFGFSSLNSSGDGQYRFPNSFHLPGVLAGFVYNHSPELSFGLAVDSYVERVDHLRWSDQYTRTYLDINLLNFADMILWLDLYRDLDWALRLEFHNRYAEYLKPGGETNQKVVESSLSRTDHWIGFGFVYHML